ncbi:histidine phosphatase family protein [Tianweitania sp. BSSL-BM11]|uniref:Histidine phosphatase family protein n=1 Tax=Tianweitania aestuarii TaxID=2814886 RepID=A0ABS5RUU8_9HYPH|nr:histidine phosphatase family protein [Tianweitania aestuarii]MBS9720784.1 histidine phosphatase family protein [Tianweitania aestuarii]
MIRIASLLLVLLLNPLVSFVAPANATEAGWALLREGGHVVLLRHAYAAGTTDAPRIDLDDCRTQRGLSDRGKQQARRLGSLIAARAQPVVEVYTSRYCRTRETADLAFGSSLVTDLPALDPTGDQAAQEAAKNEILSLVEGFTRSGNLVFVTHDDVIRSLTGSGAREGEAVIVRRSPEGLHIAARIIFN